MTPWQKQRLAFILNKIDLRKFQLHKFLHQDWEKANCHSATFSFGTEIAGDYQLNFLYLQAEKTIYNL